MHAWARWALLAVVCALSASVAAPARADFPRECTPAYLALFDPRLDDVPYDCVERLRVPVRVRSGDRFIRIIHDSSVDWAAGEAELARFDQGVRAAADAIGRLGDVDLMNVTVLLADDFSPPEGEVRFSDIAAQARLGDPSECHVIVYLVGAAPQYAASDVAHEIFHCVQDATLSEAQMSSGSAGLGGGGDWWIEGSAEWFAILALPDDGRLTARVEAFDTQSPTTPLNNMAYGAVVFFMWLGADASPPYVMNFLRRMAPSNDETAQRAAMGAALARERWLDFSQAYLDRAITDPRGGRLALNPADGEIWEWSATQTRTVSLTPFLIHRGVIAFQCGRWGARVTPGAMHRARPEEGDAWGALPASIDTTSGSGGAFRFAAVNATAADATLSVRGTMEAGCGDCAGVRTTDACVVGIWQLTGGGPAEWMRRHGVAGNFSTGNQIVQFRADGTFITSVARAEMEIERDRAQTEGHAETQAAGRWSTSGGRLNLCADMQTRTGRVTTTSPDGRFTRPAGDMPPGTTSERYSCAGGRLDTEREIPGMSSMPFNYSRIGE